MISYRKLAMRVLGHPLRVPTNTPRPASHRVTALALTAAMVAGMAAPAYADIYYIGDGNITITKDEHGDIYVKHSKNTDATKDGDGNIIIKGGKRSEDTTAPGGGSSEGGTSATSAAKSASATLKIEDSENEDKDMVYPGDTKGSNSSEGGGEEKENQSTEKDQTGDTTDGKNTGAGSSDPESTGSEGGTTGSGGTSDSERSDTKADDTLTTGGEKNDPKPGGIPTPAEGTESTESNRSAPESQFTYTSAYNDEGTSNESTTALKTAADNFKAAAQNVIRIINKLVNNESTGKDNTLNVTLDNVNITAKNDAALSVEGAGDTKITLRGSNTLTNDLLHAGLEHNEKSENGSYTGKLTITSEKDADGNDTGSLTATGGNGAAGIGSSDGNGAGTIEITGGNITANGGNNAAGIGSSYNSNGNTTINIEGGTIVKAQGGSGRGSSGGAGIGSGDIGSGYTGSSTTNITISGGTIKEAVGGNTGDGIGGGGSSNNTTVTINGGRIEKAQGGQGYSIFDGGDGIHSDDALTIPGTASIGSAIGGSGGSGVGVSGAGNGIYSGGKLTISGGTIGTAQGGNATADHKDGGSGIYSKGDLSIEGGTIGTAQGGSGRSGGYGIRSNQELTIAGGEIQQTTGGNATGTFGTGGDGIRSNGTLTIHSGNIETAQGGTSANGNGGSGIRSGDTLTISNSATITNATGGDADNGTGGSGIRGDGNSDKLSIYNATITNAIGGSGKSGGSGIFGKTMEIISSAIQKAIGGRSTGEESYHTGGAGIVGSESLTIEGGTTVQAVGGDADSGTGGSGIRSNGTLTIRGGEIQQTTGGGATGKGGTGGSGIRSGGSVKIWGGTITKATGGSGKSGGDGIGSYGALTISGSAKIETAQGGDSTNGTGGSGISSGGILTIEGSANIGTAQGGASTNGTGGDGIHSGSVVKISGDTITKATGGNATGENSTGGSGIGGSFVNVEGGTINTTGGSGKSGGAGVSTESGIVSIGNSDTPLDLTATAPDADNAIRGRDGKKLDEIIHLEENGKRGLVKLVENGVTRLFHNGVYTKSIYPAGSETHPLGDWRITKKPTCTEKGERQRSCKVEHCVVTETEELPALGHQWSGWMPVQGDSSREYRICVVCNAVEYRDVSHNSGSGDSTISTGLRVLDPAQTDILQNAQLVRLNQISDVLYIDVTHETASLQGVLSDLTGLRSERIGTIVFSTERCTSTLSLSDVAALGAGDTPFTLRHSDSTATFTVGGADHSALLR